MAHRLGNSAKMEDAPKTIGPFRILGVLGHGGMGVVYRGVHVETAEPAAIKTVRTPSRDRLENVRREIRALARIRHPDIVRILDEGLEGGLPWYAMELLEGRTLKERADALWKDARLARVDDEGRSLTAPTASRAFPTRPGLWARTSSGETDRVEDSRSGVQEGGEAEAPAHPDAATLRSVSRGRPLENPEQSGLGHTRAGRDGESLAPGQRALAAGGAMPEVLRIARALCSPLAYLHGEGIVHRDLKPANIFIRRDGRPVLMDFGLASRVGSQSSREAIDVAGWIVGTCAYMAPEQVRGNLVDARADLYALGCLLYELLTGRRPFLGATSESVLAQHLTQAPERPSDLVKGLPAVLEALVLRLLAKHPAERLGHAADVAAMLAAAGAEGANPGDGPRPRAYLYRPGFAGRKETLRRLEEHRERLELGIGGVVLVGGESGVGKTRLVIRFARQDRLRGIRILVGESQPAGLKGPGSGPDGRPLQALRRPLQAVADHCRESGPEEAKRVLGPRARLLQAYEPALARLPGLEADSEPAELPPAAALLRLFHYLTETFAALARTRPLLIALDDLQWADELTLGFLAYLLRSARLKSIPLLVLATYRTEEIGEPLRRLIDVSRTAQKDALLQLERLDETDVAAIVGDMLAIETAPGELVRFLARESEGNPFFVAEYLRAAVSEGLFWRDPAGRWQIPTAGVSNGLSLPRSVRELVERRLDRLEPAARRVLEAAAVLGRKPDPRLVARILGLDGTGAEPSAAFHATFTELVRRQILEEPETGLLRFAHDKIRELAYAAIPAQARRELHRAVAEAIEHGWPDPRESALSLLGHHWAEAGETLRARECYLAAGRQAVGRYSYGEAKRCFEAFLGLVSTPTSETIGVRNELGQQSLLPLSLMDEARRQHETALQEARRLRDGPAECRSLRALGHLQLTIGQMREARELCEQGLRLARELGDIHEEAQCLWNLGTVDYLQGRLNPSRQRLEAAMKRFTAAGDQKGKARSLGLLAAVHGKQGHYRQTRRLYLRALRLHREGGQRTGECVTLGNLGNLAFDLGRIQQAHDLYVRSLALARELGHRRQESVVLDALGAVCFERGQFEEARSLYEQALRIARQSELRREEGAMLGHLGSASTAQMRLAEARDQYEQALGIAREVGSSEDEAAALTGMATVERLSRGDLELAERLAAEAERLLRAEAPAVELALCLCERGHIELAAGRSADSFLAEVEQIAAAVDARPGSTLESVLRKLRLGQETFLAGACRQEAV